MSSKTVRRDARAWRLAPIDISIVGSHGFLEAYIAACSMVAHADGELASDEKLRALLAEVGVATSEHSTTRAGMLIEGLDGAELLAARADDPALARRARRDVEQVGAEAFDLAGNRSLSPSPDGEHGDHRRHADDNAQDGQG